MTKKYVNLLVGSDACAHIEKCINWKATFQRRMIGNYISTEKNSSKLVPAIIDLSHYEDFDSYLATAKKVHKGAAMRQTKKAVKAGYFCELFEWSNYIPDVVEINTSKQQRSGGIMKEAYLRSVEEMGGAPTNFRNSSEILCPLHNTYCWGIFAPIMGYRQGDIVTNQKLLGYIKFKRNGNLATYTTILGHGEFLQFGIMHELHFRVLAWVLNREMSNSESLDYILYGAIDSGGSGLQQWKKRALFEPLELYLKHDEIR